MSSSHLLLHNRASFISVHKFVGSGGGGLNCEGGSGGREGGREGEGGGGGGEGREGGREGREGGREGGRMEGGREGGEGGREGGEDGGREGGEGERARTCVASTPPECSPRQQMCPEGREPRQARGKRDVSSVQRVKSHCRQTHRKLCSLQKAELPRRKTRYNAHQRMRLQACDQFLIPVII